MIVDAILSAIFGCINAVIGLMPDYELPELTTSSGGQIQRYMHALAFLVPAQALIIVITGNLVLRGVIAGWGLIVFIYHQFWGSD